MPDKEAASLFVLLLLDFPPFAHSPASLLLDSHAGYFVETDRKKWKGCS
jgi:hypothetical protein